MTESKGKILVVDDDVPVAEMLAEHLTELGYQVISAHGGIEALTKLDLEKPHVILLDVRMPEMDGVEVLRRIRSFDSKVGILMITGNDDVDLAKETIELGAYDYLLKPIDFDYLSRAVDKLMATAAAPVDDQRHALRARSALRFGPRDLSRNSGAVPGGA